MRRKGKTMATILWGDPVSCPRASPLRSLMEASLLPRLTWLECPSCLAFNLVQYLRDSLAMVF